jgi:hypothetical protein
MPMPMPFAGKHVVRVTETGEDGQVKVSTFSIPQMNAALQAELKRAVADVKAQEAEAARLRADEIRKAVSAAKIDQKIALAMKAHARELKLAQAQAGRAAGAVVAKAIADVDVAGIVSRALAAAGPAIDKALAVHGKHIEVNVDTDDSSSQ